MILPLLVILVFGITSFGVVFAQKLALGNAAREAARLGVVQDRTCGDIEQAAQDAANSISMKGTDTTVVVSTTGDPSPCSSNANIPCQDSAPNDELSVRVDFDSELTIPLVFVNPSYTLTGDGVFRCEFH